MEKVNKSIEETYNKYKIKIVYKYRCNNIVINLAIYMILLIILLFSTYVFQNYIQNVIKLRIYFIYKSINNK